MRKKLIMIALLLVILFSCAALSSVANAYTPNIDVAETEYVINSFSNNSITYAVEQFRFLKSISGKSGYEYILCDLKPSGFAVLTVDNYPLQICYSDGVNPPISMSDKNVYYYLCPGFAVRINGSYVNCETNRVVSSDNIQKIAKIEQRILESSKSSIDSVNNRSATTVYQVPNSHYFDDLVNYGTNSSGQSCLAVASGMIFGYYDFYVNSNYVATQYSQTSTGHSVGTSEAFHSLLCGYIWGNNPITMKPISNATAGLSDYLEDRGFPFSFVTNPIAANMAVMISTRRPVVGTIIYDETSGHAVAVYRCSISGSTRMYDVHMGYPNKTSASNWQSLNQSLFGSFGYIEDCMVDGAHTYSYRYTSRNYHSGSNHYYEKEKYCTRCPVDCGEVIWESRACNNCIEIMSANNLQ